MSGRSWRHAPLPHQIEQGRQTGVAGNRLAILPEMLTHAAGLNVVGCVSVGMPDDATLLENSVFKLRNLKSK